MVRDEQILLQLNNIKDITNSDILALAELEGHSRKLNWQHLSGILSERTYKIKQNAKSGLTGQALRTGKPQSILIETAEERFCFGEAIMMTECLSQLYVWPINQKQLQYQAVIIIGKRQSESYKREQIDQATVLVQQLNDMLSASSIGV